MRTASALTNEGQRLSLCLGSDVISILVEEIRGLEGGNWLSLMCRYSIRLKLNGYCSGMGNPRYMGARTFQQCLCYVPDNNTPEEEFQRAADVSFDGAGSTVPWQHYLISQA